MFLKFDFHPLVIAGFACGIAMLAPSATALDAGETDIARAFLIGGLAAMVLAILVGIATANSKPSAKASAQFARLGMALAGLPALSAVPVVLAVPGAPLLDVYFEMVSCITTTGATAFADADALHGSIHLWRGIVAWIGGFLFLSAAVGIAAAAQEAVWNRDAARVDAESAIAAAERRRALRAIRLLAAYVLLTLALWSGLAILGEETMAAAMHAMSAISTSGVSAGGAVPRLGGSAAAEIMVLAFLLIAASSIYFAVAAGSRTAGTAAGKPELWIAAAIGTLACAALLPLRISVPAYPAGFEEIADLFRSVLGTAFTVVSFLTTTGFESAIEPEPPARSWGGYGGIVLATLALIGGGLFSTSGGMKAFRIHALARLGAAEIRRMVYPSAVRSDPAKQGLRRDELYSVGALFMLLIIAAVLVMLAIAVSGAGFETSVIVAISAVSATGPLAPAVLGGGFSYGDFGAAQQLVLAAAMVCGRLELAALITVLAASLGRG